MTKGATGKYISLLVYVTPSMVIKTCRVHITKLTSNIKH